MYDSFNVEQNKIEKNWERSNNNKNDIINLEKKIIDLKSLHGKKNIISIPILEKTLIGSGVDVNNSVSFFEFQFLNMPEWMIPMTEVRPVFSSEEGVNIDDPLITVLNDFNYFWDIRDKVNPLLKIHVSGVVSQLVILNNPPPFGTLVTLPLFVDLNVKLINSRIFDLIQHDKGL